MARWENEDVSGLNLPEPQKVEKIYFDKSGSSCDEKSAYAMECVSESSSFFYIRFSRGELIDPHSIDSNTKLKNNPDFKKVKKPCFDNYIKYLKTKNRLYFTRSRRLAMEN